MGSIAVERLTINFKRRSNTSALPFIGGKAEVWSALSGVTFKIGDGERVGVIGRNGAGKSTLLKAISGIYPPHEGQIEVCGSVVPLLELGAGFDNRRSVRENIYLNGAIMGLSSREVRDLEVEVIQFAGLGDFADMQLKNLSSGMRSRLGFSIATCFKPEILILDEVFAAGDASFIERAKERMYAMIDRCQILLLVSHRLSLIEELCARVLVIEKGRLVFDGTAEDGIQYYEQNIVKNESKKQDAKRVRLF